MSNSGWSFIASYTLPLAILVLAISRFTVAWSLVRVVSQCQGMAMDHQVILLLRLSH